MTQQQQQRFSAVPFSEIQRLSVEWLDDGRVPIGGVAILFGDPGIGKSQWTILTAARLSRGELGDPAASLIITGEDDASRTIRPRLEAASANLDLVHIVRGRDAGFVLPDDVDELERLVAETASRLVSIDPLTAHIAAEVKSHNDASVRTALRPLAEIAERHSCAIVVVMHMNKSESSHAIYRVGGSIGFVGAARSSLLFARDPDDPDGETGCRRVLVNVKNNLAPEAPTLIYEVKPILLPARGNEPEANVSRLELVGESARNGREVLALADDDERSEVDEAAEVLLSLIADGPRLSADVKKAMRVEGYTVKQIRTARERLQQTKRLELKSGGMPRRTWWFPSGAQQSWAPLDVASEGHDWSEPHERRESGASNGADGPSRALSQEEGTTEFTEAEKHFLAEFEAVFGETT